MTDDNVDWDFFLTRAGADKETAEYLYDYLVDKSRVFLDSRSLRLGDDWDTELATAQRRSLVTVVLVSANTAAAYYQREEVAAAISLARENRDNHRVVPIYTDAKPDDARIPYGLRLKHGISLGEECSLADAAARLLDLRRSLSGSGVIRQVDEKAHGITKRPARTKERIALLRWLGRIPDNFDAYFRALWQAVFGKDSIPLGETERLERNLRALLNDYGRITEKLPDMFAQTGPSENEKGCFAEMFPAFQRECTACFTASRRLIGGVSAPTTDGKQVIISFSSVYSALEIGEHLRILRMAAEELIILFPVDDVEEARREPTA